MAKFHEWVEDSPFAMVSGRTGEWVDTVLVEQILLRNSKVLSPYAKPKKRGKRNGR